MEVSTFRKEQGVKTGKWKVSVKTCNYNHIKCNFVSRLVNKVEDLERLMNDEVTDINEILNVINTIQVKPHTIQQNKDSHPLFQIDKNIPELKSKSQRFL